MSKLLEDVLKRPSDYYIPEYEEIFKNEYEVIGKIKDFLTNQEFEVLYRMIEEEEYELCKLIKYFQSK